MIDERNGGTIWQFLSRGSRNNQTNLRAGWLFLYFFTKNQLPEGEWIFRLFPEAWRPKINGKAGSMLNVLSSINEAFCFTFVYARNIPTNSPPSKDSPPFTRLRRINWICQSSPSPRFALLIFSPFLLFHRKNPSFRETTFERSRVKNSMMIEEWLDRETRAIVGIDIGWARY